MTQSDSRHTVLIALGSNLGDRAANLAACRAALPPQVTPLAASPIYETEPWGYTDQPDFLNQVIKAETSLSPSELLAYLKDIETRLGRQPSFRYGPRQIDLDILLYDQAVIDSDALQVPHPRLAERAFVLVPLADLVPDWRHPISGQTIHQMLAAIDQQSVHPYRG